MAFKSKRTDIDRTTPGFIFSCDCEELYIDYRDGHMECSECHGIVDYKFPCGIIASNARKLSESFIIEAARIDTAFFSWYFFPQHIKLRYGIPVIHQEFYRLYDNPENRYIAQIGSRDSAKTTTGALVIPAKETLYQTMKFGAICSEESKAAAWHLLTLKLEFEANKVVKKFFGNIMPTRGFGGATYKWREDDFITKSGIRWIGRGMDQRTRGGKFQSERYSLLIAEDPESGKNTKNAESILDNGKWFSREMLGSMANENSRAYLFANIVCSGCIADMVNQSPSWVKVFSRNEPDGEGTSFWHLYWPLEKQRQKKEELRGRDDYESWEIEYNNNPNPESTRTFDTNNLKFWMGSPIRREAFAALNVEVVLKKGWESGRLEKQDIPQKTLPVNFLVCADIASSEAKRSDFTVVEVLAGDAQSNIFLVELERFKSKQIDHIGDRVFENILKYNPQYAAIESNNVGIAVIQYVRKLIVKHNLSGKGEFIRTLVIEVTNTTNKEDDIRIKLQQPLNAGMLYIKREEHQQFKTELVGFPKLIHEDCLDAMRTGLQKLRPCEFESADDAMRHASENNFTRKRIIRKINEKSSSHVTEKGKLWLVK